MINVKMLKIDDLKKKKDIFGYFYIVITKSFTKINQNYKKWPYPTYIA